MTAAILDEEAPAKPLSLFGWQDGKSGFCYVGTGAPYFPEREWEDHLYLGLFAGGDSGKTFAGAFRHFLQIQAFPNSVNIIAAPDFTRLERATLAQWKEFLTTAGLIEGVHYEHNVTLKKITYWNGAIDWLASLDNPDSVRGIRACFIWLDEAGYAPWAAMKALQPRLTRPGFPHQMTMTSTPVGKDHWTYPFYFPVHAHEEGYSEIDIGPLVLREVGDPSARFHGIELKKPSGESIGRRLCVFAETRENPYGGQEEWDELKVLLGEGTPEFEQEARGRFTVPGGITYPAWNTEFHALPRSKWPGEERQKPGWKPSHVCMGGDYGVDHAAAWSVGGLDTDGREYVLESWKKTGSDPYEMRLEGIRLAEKWGASYAFMEHEPTWFRVIHPAQLDVLRDGKIIHSEWPAGFVVKRANKFVGSLADPSGGIGLVGSTLRARHSDGGPNYIVDRDLCRPLVREYENYQRPGTVNERKPTSERPLHVGDDLMDAERYRKTMQALWLHWDRAERRAPAGKLTLAFA